MKKTTYVALAGFFLLTQVAGSWATTTNFSMKASLPKATASTMSVNSVVTGGTVTAPTYTFTPVAGTALNWALAFDPVNGIYLPPNAFAIDVANAGAGSADVNIKYAETTAIPNQLKGLGDKATADFRKVIYDATTVSKSAELVLAAHTKKVLKGLNETITKAESTGGWVRIYLGVADGKKPAIGSAIGEPFTNADQGGDYTGTLTITTTL